MVHGYGRLSLSKSKTLVLFKIECGPPEGAAF